MTKIGITLVLLIGGLFAACGEGGSSGGNNGSNQGPSGEKGAKGKELETQEVFRTNIVVFSEEAGSVQPRNVIKVKFDISGRISELYKERGDPVKKGEKLAMVVPDLTQLKTYAAAVTAYKQALAKYETASNSYAELQNRQQKSLQSAQLDYQKTEANLKDAENAYKEAQGLYKKKMVTKSSYQTLLNNYNIAKTDVDRAKLALDTLSKYDSAPSDLLVAKNEVDRTKMELDAVSTYGTLQEGRGVPMVSPASGTILSRSVDVGDYILSSASYQGATVIYSIADISDLIIEVPINEMNILSVKNKAKVTYTIDAVADQTFDGYVSRIFPNPTNVDNVKKYIVQVEMASDRGRYQPGMSCQVKFMVQQKTGVLSLPLGSVIRDEVNKQDFVFIINPEVKDKGYERRVIKTGLKDEDNIEIMDGLEEGQLVVKDPYSIPDALTIKRQNSSGGSRRGGGPMMF